MHAPAALAHLDALLAPARLLPIATRDGCSSPAPFRTFLCPVHYLFLQGSLPAEHAALPPHPHLEPTLHGVGSGGFGSGAFGSSNFGSGNFGSGGYEPTMTLATRSAFAAINNMFKVSWAWLLSGVCV